MEKLTVRYKIKALSNMYIYKYSSEYKACIKLKFICVHTKKYRLSKNTFPPDFEAVLFMSNDNIPSQTNFSKGTENCYMFVEGTSTNNNQYIDTNKKIPNAYKMFDNAILDVSYSDKEYAINQNYFNQGVYPITLTRHKEFVKIFDKFKSLL